MANAQAALSSQSSRSGYFNFLSTVYDRPRRGRHYYYTLCPRENPSDALRGFLWNGISWINCLNLGPRTKKLRACGSETKVLVDLFAARSGILSFLHASRLCWRFSWFHLCSDLVFCCYCLCLDYFSARSLGSNQVSAASCFFVVTS